MLEADNATSVAIVLCGVYKYGCLKGPFFQFEAKKCIALQFQPLNEKQSPSALHGHQKAVKRISLALEIISQIDTNTNEIVMMRL